MFDRIDILVPPLLRNSGAAHTTINTICDEGTTCVENDNRTIEQVGCSDDQPSILMDNYLHTIISTQPYIYRMPVIGIDRVRVGVRLECI